MKTFKIVACIAILALMSTAAFAEGRGGKGGTNTTSSAKNDANAQQGQGQSVDSHNVSTGSDMGDMVGAAIAPALTTTLTETCMGSTSIGAGWSGGGVSFGTTWRDSACVRRLDAREIKNIHPNFAVVAKELMCDSSNVYDAFKRAGIPCVEREDDKKADKKKDTASVTPVSSKRKANTVVSNSNGFF